MQQEMIRLHRGEENALTPLVEKVFRPVHERILQVIDEGVASGELIAVDRLQITYAVTQPSPIWDRPFLPIAHTEPGSPPACWL